MFMERLVKKPDEILKYIRFFRGKLQTDKLIVFVGAGVSRNVKGMPDWNDLIKKWQMLLSTPGVIFAQRKPKNVKRPVSFMMSFQMMNF